MTKKPRTPEQKLAREIQATTGKKYSACLTEARAQLAEENHERRVPRASAPPGTSRRALPFTLPGRPRSA